MESSCFSRPQSTASHLFARTRSFHRPTYKRPGSATGDPRNRFRILRRCSLKRSRSRLAVSPMYTSEQPKKKNSFCRFIFTNKVTIWAASYSACVVYILKQLFITVSVKVVDIFTSTSVNNSKTLVFLFVSCARFPCVRTHTTFCIAWLNPPTEEGYLIKFDTCQSILALIVEQRINSELLKPFNNPPGVSPSKGKQGTTRGKEKIFWPRWESNPRPPD